MAIYTGYINYLLKRYCQNQKIDTAVDKINFLSADKIIQSIPEADKEVIFKLFDNAADLNFNINKMVSENSMSKNKIHKILRKTSKMIAEERGLI